MSGFQKELWKYVSLDLLEKIWLYAKPRKVCILRDLKSKSGVYKKIEKSCRL
jgi:hypothetical protein